MKLGGKTICSIGELVDIFPTVVDLAHLPPLKQCQGNEKLCTEGKSLLPYLVENISSSENVAFSQFPRPGETPTIHPNSDKPKLRQIKIMGYSIRTDNFRYTAWIKFHWKTFKKSQFISSFNFESSAKRR